MPRTPKKPSYVIVTHLFDSYGMPPENFSMSNYLNSTATTWKYSKQRIQGDSVFCGHYCILFLLFRARLNSKKFFLGFSKNLSKNDSKIEQLLHEF